MQFITAQEDINGRLYRRADLVRYYTVPNLWPAEATALVRYRDDIVDRRVLDLGCGAGRMATYLRPLTKHYVGFDISPHMLAYCRQTFAGLTFLRGDIRDLTRFAAGSFDAVFAVCNLFDAVSHADRLQVLAAVKRALMQRGLLFFSSHNRNYAELGTGPRLHFSRNPFTMGHSVLDYFQAHANHRRIKPHQRFETEYALVNDSAHKYAVLHYYINRYAQAQQLAQAGFHLLECLDESGATLNAGEDDSTCSSIHYVARPQ